MKNILPLLALVAFVGCTSEKVEVVTVQAGDLNRDGYADLVVGAPFHDAGGGVGSNRGAVFVYLGSASGPSSTPDLSIFGAEDGARFGTSVAMIGDANGDSYPDIIVGAPYDDADDISTDSGADRGRAFVYLGGATLNSVVDLTMSGAEDDALFGSSVSWTGDFNAGGYDDWIVGAPFDDGDGNTTDSGTDAGRAFIYYGGSSLNGIADLTLTGPEAGSRFGTAVSSTGDINSGGAYDVAVGAPFDDGDGNATNEGDDRGRVYVFYGGTLPDGTADLTMTGDEVGALFGLTVAAIFDVNNDNAHDLLVGAPFHDAGGTDRGRAYVFYGGSTVDTVADLTISGTETSGRLGESLSRGGDVNGDGEMDFLVGAPFEDPGAITDAGRVYLFLGGSTVDATADVTFSGGEAFGFFGNVIGGFGDSDADGGRDIYIGAPRDDTDGNATDDGDNRGRVYVYSGGSVLLDNVADKTLNGDQDSAEFGTGIGN